MKIKIYEHTDDPRGTRYIKLKWEIEIDESELITFLRTILGKVKPKE